MFLTEIAALPILQSVTFREHFCSNMNGKFHSNRSEKNIERTQFVIFFEFDVFHPLAKIQAVLNCEIGFFPIRGFRVWAKCFNSIYVGELTKETVG